MATENEVMQAEVVDEVVVDQPQKADKVRQKQKKNKKKEIKLNRGITGAGEDYTVYVPEKREKLVALTTGALVGFMACYLYFNSIPISIIIAIIAAYKAVPIYCDMKLKKRKNTLRIQFRDLLESLSNSYTVGMTSSRAFHAAYEDMKVEHGADAYITKEMELLCLAHDNQGYEIKNLLLDFAQRSGLDDIRSFAGVFDISTDLGGNVAKVIRETRDMISDKIEVELEIQTMVTGQRNQLNILAIMPFVVSFAVRSFSTDDGNIVVIILKLVALSMFVFAYWMGTKIVDIKV